MVLDVNMGAPLRDEAELMTQAVTLIQSLSDLPLCLDSSIIEVLEAGLAAYQGKALVNSVTAEDERLDAILPLVKRYGAAVIALPNDEEEIPEEPARRLELARKIIDVATGKYGIPIEDIVIDPLAMPIGADTSLVLRTLETIELLREEFGVNMTLGASNVSFGMPDRGSIGAAFLPMAIAAGLTSAIMDARSPQLVQAVKAADLLTQPRPLGRGLDRRAPGPPGGAPAAQRGSQQAASQGAGSRQQQARRRSATHRRRVARTGRSAFPARQARGCACRQASRLFDAASWNGIAIDSTCGGHGTCKKCKVRVIDGPRRSRRWTPAHSRRTNCAAAGGWPAGPWPTRTCRSRSRRW